MYAVNIPPAVPITDPTKVRPNTPRAMRRSVARPRRWEPRRAVRRVIIR